MPDPAPRRGRLTRAAVVEAAVELADRQGLAAVSMRNVAGALQVAPMALYRHVTDKDDLLDAMVDRLIEEFGAPPEDTSASRASAPPAGMPAEPGWVSAARTRIWAARAVLARHPWARQAIETRTRRTAAVLSHMEALTSVLLSGGVSADLTHHALHALGNRIWGFSPELFPGDATAGSSPLDPADYPGILAVAAQARRRRPDATGCDEDFEFGFALDLILAAVARLHDAGWASHPTTGTQG